MNKITKISIYNKLYLKVCNNPTDYNFICIELESLGQKCDSFNELQLFHNDNQDYAWLTTVGKKFIGKRLTFEDNNNIKLVILGLCLAICENP